MARRARSQSLPARQPAWMLVAHKAMKGFHRSPKDPAITPTVLFPAIVKSSRFYLTRPIAFRNAMVNFQNSAFVLFLRI